MTWPKNRINRIGPNPLRKRPEEPLPPFAGYDAEPGLRELVEAIVRGYAQAEAARVEAKAKGAHG